jgi:RNA polymerase sigma-70 factor (ECF subfamily)
MTGARAELWPAIFSAPYGCATDDASELRREGEKQPLPLKRRYDAAPDSTIGGVPPDVLLTGLRAGDLAAFETLYLALYKILWSIALLQTRSAETAEEIVHDVFSRLWVNRATLRIDGDIKVYLSAAVRNAARNVRKHVRVVDAMERAVSGAVLTLPASGQPLEATDVVVEHDEFLRAYREALTTLTEHERTAAYLRWEEGWSLEQVGDVLGMSKMGAHKVMARVQRKLQLLLSGYHD